MQWITLIKRGSQGSFVVLMNPIWRRFTPFTWSGSSSLVRSMPYMYWASSRNMAYTIRKGEHLIMERRWLGRIHKMLAHSSNTNVNQLWYVMLHACKTIQSLCVWTIQFDSKGTYPLWQQAQRKQNFSHRNFKKKGLQFLQTVSKGNVLTIITMFVPM
jgi:hypothetical protein